MPTCHRHYPGRLDGAGSLVYLHRRRPSRCNSQVGSCNCFFQACSAFTHAAASIASTGWSEPVPGRELHPLKSSAFSRRTVSLTTVTRVSVCEHAKRAKGCDPKDITIQKGRIEESRGNTSLCAGQPASEERSIVFDLLSEPLHSQ